MSHLRCLLYCLLLLTGCGPAPQQAPDTGNSFSFVDDAGNTITLPHPPRSVISLAPNLTELLYAIDAGDLVTAVSLADDYPPAVDTLPRYSSYPMDFEALVGYGPDLLIATDAINNPRDAEQFTSVGLKIAYFSFKSWADIPRVMRALGDITDRSTAATQAADALDAQRMAIQQKTAAVKPTRALFLIGSDQLYAFGRDNYIHEAIAIAGGKSLTDSLAAVSPILSEEFVLTAQPDVILGSIQGAAQLLTHHPAFENVPALANDRVCTVDGSLVLRPGPRLLEGITAMARCMHPELFE
ncbi:MAG: ABC transporter substrate-binding protein [Bacteroidota bacterium]